MTRKRRRLYAVTVGMLLLGGAAALVLTAFSDSLVFFYSPTELQAKQLPDGRQVRIGGLVEQGSVQKDPATSTVHFAVTDLKTSLPVVYTGVLPDLFREGQGVVAEGAMQKGTFTARNVLAKHDEKYMPPEVAKALKASGRWQEGGTQ